MSASFFVCLREPESVADVGKEVRTADAADIVVLIQLEHVLAVDGHLEVAHLDGVLRVAGSAYVELSELGRFWHAVDDDFHRANGVFAFAAVPYLLSAAEVKVQTFRTGSAPFQGKRKTPEGVFLIPLCTFQRAPCTLPDVSE